MKNLILLAILLTIGTKLFAQDTLKNAVYVNLGYGTENNVGNTAFIFGVGYERKLAKKLVLMADFNYFTTGIYNAENLDRDIEGVERKCNNAFFSIKLGYCLVGEPNIFNMRLKAGFSVFSFNTRYSSFVSQVFPDGTKILVPGTLRYSDEQGVRAAYHLGIDFNIPITETLHGGIGIDTYSSEILVEFFIPFVSLKKRF
jgi:hypothetical protein